jgi:apolipoprotein N-acyltransferase
MIPILISDKNNIYGLRSGLLWGLIFFAGHLVWFAEIIYTKGNGDFKILVYILAVCYFSLYAGFWFWLKQYLIYRLNRIITLKWKMFALFCTWVISTLTFMYLTCYCSLAIFGCFEGYPFINPLLPIVSWTWYIKPICYIGVVGYWGIIVTMNFLLASLLEKFDTRRLILYVFLITFPVFFRYESIKKYKHIGNIFYINPFWLDYDIERVRLFYTISRCFDYVALHNSNITCVVLPESSFHYNLLDWNSKLSAWSSLFDDGTSIIIGSHRYEGDIKYNCLYHIVNGNIIGFYDKHHLVPFVERIPFFFGALPIFCNLFTKSINFFSYPSNKLSSFHMGGFQPYICSELFFESKKPIGIHPIIFVCNDRWLGCEYARNLAKKFAWLYYFRYQIPIVYVGGYDYEVIQK